MVVARQGMTDQDGVAGAGVKLAIGFKHQVVMVKHRTTGQRQRRGKVGGLRADEADGMRIRSHHIIIRVRV